MSKTTIFTIAAFTALSLNAAPAHALSNRAWVSGHGTDATGCGAPTGPCRSFQYMRQHHRAERRDRRGRPAGYGALTITKALSIVNDGVGTAGVQQSNAGQDAITINAGANDTIHLRGLNIDGLAAAINGIHPLAGSLDIVSCVVRRFTSYGILIEPTTTNKFSITGTLASDNLDV